MGYLNRKRIILFLLSFLNGLMFFSCENFLNGSTLKNTIDDMVAAANSGFYVINALPNYSLDGVYFDSPIEIQFSKPVDCTTFDYEIKIKGENAKRHFISPVFYKNDTTVIIRPDVNNPIDMTGVLNKDVEVLIYGSTRDFEGNKLFYDYKWAYRINHSCDSNAPILNTISIGDAKSGNMIPAIDYRNCSDEMLSKIRTSKINISVTGNDIGSGVSKLLVTETRLTRYVAGNVSICDDVLVTDFECPGEFSVDENGIYKGDFTYDLRKGNYNGISRLDFVLIDGNYNRSNVASFHVLSTTSIPAFVYIDNKLPANNSGGNLIVQNAISMERWNESVKRIYFSIMNSDFENNYYYSTEHRIELKEDYEVQLEWGTNPDALVNRSRVTESEYHSPTAYGEWRSLYFDIPNLDPEKNTYARLTITDGAGNQLTQKFVVPYQTCVVGGYYGNKNLKLYFDKWSDSGFLEYKAGNHIDSQTNSYGCQGFWNGPSIENDGIYLGEIFNGIQYTSSRNFSSGGIYLYLANRVYASYVCDIYGPVGKRNLLPEGNISYGGSSVLESCSLQPVRERNSGKCCLSAKFKDNALDFRQLRLVGQYGNGANRTALFDFVFDPSKMERSIEMKVPSINAEVDVTCYGYAPGMDMVVLDFQHFGNPCEEYDNIPPKVFENADIYRKMEYMNGGFVRCVPLTDIGETEELKVSMYYSNGNKVSIIDENILTGKEGDVRCVYIPLAFEKKYAADMYWLKLEDGAGNCSESAKLQHIGSVFDYAITQSHVENYGLNYSIYSDTLINRFETYAYSSSKWNKQGISYTNFSTMPKQEYYFNSGSCYSDMRNNFIKVYAFGANSIAVPRIFWGGNRFDVRTKRIEEFENNKYCVLYDSPCLIQTFYSPVNLGNEIGKWEIYGNTINEIVRKPVMQGQEEFFMYSASDGDIKIPFGNYFVVAVYYADGTSKISSVGRKID